MLTNEVVAILSNIPHVKFLKKPIMCDGWVTETVASGPMAGGYRKRKCLRSAHWHFQQSAYKPKKGRAKSGYYCDYHIFTCGVQYSLYEIGRAERAYERKMKGYRAHDDN